VAVATEAFWDKSPSEGEECNQAKKKDGGHAKEMGNVCMLYQSEPVSDEKSIER
jgi:hypothetical protein